MSKTPRMAPREPGHPSPDDRPASPSNEEIEARVNALVEARERERQEALKTAEAAHPAEEVDGIAPSHPDCRRCAQVRQKTLARVKKSREKKASK